MIQISLSPIEIPWWLALILLVYLVLWVWSVVAVLSEKQKDCEIETLTWVIVLIFLPVVGLIIYAFIGPGDEEGEEQRAGEKAEG